MRVDAAAGRARLATDLSASTSESHGGGQGVTTRDKEPSAGWSVREDVCEPMRVRSHHGAGATHRLQGATGRPSVSESVTYAADSQRLTSAGSVTSSAIQRKPGRSCVASVVRRDSDPMPRGART